MKSNEVISELMEKQGVSQAAMARRLKSTRGTVGNQLGGRNAMTLAKCQQYLAQLGYVVAFVPNDLPRYPKGTYVIDMPEAKEVEEEGE